MSRNPYLEAAFSIGSDIANKAIFHNNACNWLGYISKSLPGEKDQMYGALESDFYAGTSGIAYFLGYLAFCTNDKHIERVAMAALRQSIDYRKDISDFGLESIYIGIGGTAMVAYELGKLFQREDLLKESDTMIHRLIRRGINDLGKDVINGPLSTIPFLIKYYRENPSDEVSDYIQLLADSIMKSAIDTKHGKTWKTIEKSTNYILGYAHGNAGFSHSLAELYDFTKDKVYLDACLSSIRYENYFYSTEHKNWPDFREFDEDNSNSSPSFMWAWCHGAPGIALSRARVYELIKQDILAEDIHRAVESTLNSIRRNIESSQGNFSLCHGIFGNAEAVQYAANVLAKKEWKTEVDKIAQMGIEFFIEQQMQFPCGMLDQKFSPSLMVGTAGMGLFYLRLAEENTPYATIIRS
jgi:lantibiotic modifying enzyme